MNILQIHNEYRQRGGEDVVLDLERDLLRNRGHHVQRFTVSNKSLGAPSLRMGIETVWSPRSNKKLREILHETSPDILHIHNTFPQLSPSIYWAGSERFPVVQTFHNYRSVCANGLLMRDGLPCELCVGRMPWPALRYRCYRDSLPATGAIVAMQVAHRAVKTYSHKVDAYINLTEFSKSLISRSGIPAELLYVKPNFIPDPLPWITTPPQRKNQVVFVGRFVQEKGVDLLLNAWAKLRPSGTRLVIIGDGREKPGLKRMFNDLPGVEWRGWVPQNEVLREVASARYLVMPSRYYEGFPMVVVEALAVGTPVIAPDHGGFPEVIPPSCAELLFAPVNVADLSKLLRRALGFSYPIWQQLSEDSRRHYLRRYTPEINYRQLIYVYEKAIEHARSRKQGNSGSC
jgi:glycosyltransferase involved in cell wall biosynthesis